MIVPVWRRVVATWSIPIREFWGRQAEQYELQGMTWDQAERAAFKDCGGSMNQAREMAPRADPLVCPAWIFDPSLTFSSESLPQPRPDVPDQPPSLPRQKSKPAKPNIFDGEEG